MSIDLTSNTSISGSIDYDYGRISLYPSNFLSDGSVSLNYSSPNIIVNINSNDSMSLKKSHIAKKIYVNDSPVHSLNGNGEIIVEHKDFIGNSEKLFLIIPVNKKKGVPKTDNAINSLITNLDATNKVDIDFNFNVNLDNKTGYYYYTNTDSANIKSHFIVFEKIIDINNLPNTSSVPTELDSAASAQLTIYKGKSKANKTDKGVVNSMTSKEDQIYIDCQPTGVSKETISSYNVPINSEYTEKSALINFERSTTTIVLFSVACVLSFLVGPELYKTAIINNIIRHIGNQKPTDNDGNKYNGCDDNCDDNVYKNEQLLGGVDSLLVIMIFWIFIAMLGVGVHFKSSLTTTSLYFIMFAISMMLGIYNKRQDKTYMTHTTHNDLEYTLYEWFFDSKKNVPESVNYNFMGYNIKGIGGITQEVFRQWAKLIAFLLASGLSIGLIAGLLKGEARDLYGSIIMPILFIVYIILLLAGLEKEAKNVQSAEPQDNGFLGTIGNLFGPIGKLFEISKRTEGGGENNGVFIGGSSNDNNDFGNTVGTLLGVATMILSFVSIANQKSDK
jgi:hypothetical protein